MDDATEREHVDVRTAAALLTTGVALACQHCQPVPEPPTLDVQNHVGDAA